MIWGTYLKRVTKYQVSAINSCWEKWDEKFAYMSNVYKNQQSRQAGSRNMMGSNRFPPYGVQIWSVWPNCTFILYAINLFNSATFVCLMLYVVVYIFILKWLFVLLYIRSPKGVYCFITVRPSVRIQNKSTSTIQYKTTIKLFFFIWITNIPQTQYRTQYPHI
jgi:hypothetical protein